MKFLLEKERKFIDNGAIKTYTTELPYPETNHIKAFRKQIIPQGQQVKIDLDQNNDHIMIVLNGIITVNSEDGLISFENATVAIKGNNSARKYFTNYHSVETEYLELSLNNNIDAFEGKIQSLIHKEKYSHLQLLASPEEGKKSISLDHPIKISRGLFKENDIFRYKRKAKNNTLFIYLIGGEMNINGWRLVYNDAIQIESNENYMIEFIKPCEILIIET